MAKPDYSDAPQRENKPDTGSASVDQQSASNKPTSNAEKRVSRYSERRNKNKEQQRKQQQQHVTDGFDAVSEALAKVELASDQ